MSDFGVKCPYCDDRFYQSDLKDHIGHHHAEQDEQSKKNGKIIRTSAIIGMSVVIGMIYMVLIA